MRQQLQTTKDVSYQAPLREAVTTESAPPHRTLTPIKAQRQGRKALTRMRFWTVPRVLTLMALFWCIPWFPAAKPAQVSPLPAKSANAVLAQIGPTLKFSYPSKRLGAMTPGEFKAYQARHDQFFGNRGTLLPKGLTDPDGFTTVEALQSSLKENHTAIERFPEVLKLPYRYQGILETTNSSGVLVVRELAKLRTRQGMLAAVEGNHQDAVTAYLDTVQLGVQVGKGGSLLAGMIGELCLKIGLQGLEKSIAHLSPEQAAQASTRLESLKQARPTLAETLTQERDTTSLALRNFYNGAKPSSLSRIPALRVVNHYVASGYERAMDEKIALVSHPDAQTATRLDSRSHADPVALAVPNLSRTFSVYNEHTKTLDAALHALQQRAGKP